MARAVAYRATSGVWRVGWVCESTEGRARSLAMLEATREAARMLACKADSVERRAATTTSAKPVGPR